MSEDLIQVTIRRGETGHETVALPLEDLPGFIDRKRQEGQLAIATAGDSSQMIRIGREILDFFRGHRREAAARGRPRKKEKVTVLNPLAGGSDGDGPELTDAQAPLMAAVLSASAAARFAPQHAGGFAEGRSIQPAPTIATRSVGRALPPDAVAEMRAWRALVAEEGEAAAMPLLSGGGIAVRSHLWPSVVYVVVLTARIVVLRDGQQVQSLCLLSADGGPIWDAVANRLQLLRAGPEGEIQVWTTAGIQ